MKTTPRTPGVSTFVKSIFRRLLPWLGAAGIGTAAAQDISFVAVLKGRHFYQKEADLVCLSDWRATDQEQGWWFGEDPDSADLPLAFEVFAIEGGPGLITSATVTIPGGAPLPLLRELPGDEELGRNDRYGSPLDLDTARPDGTHTVNLQTVNDGALSIALDLQGGLYPPAPHVTNHAALQNAGSTTSINVTWSPMGGGTGDFIMLTVKDPSTDDTVYSTGGPGSPGSLDGTATGTLIPAGALQPARDYEAELLFVRVVDGETTPVMAVAGYYQMTRFRLSTAGLPGSPTGAAFHRSVPDNGWWDVPRDSAIAFHFSRPMNPGHAVAWTINSVVDTAFTYEWINSNQTLLCRRTGGFPANAEVAWTLNLGAFRDAANQPLSGSRSGTFLTGEMAPDSSPDVSGIFVLKQREYVQTGPTPAETGLWDTEIGLSLKAFNRVRSATVTMPANGRIGWPEHSSWDAEFYLDGDFASKTDIDRFFPNGDYTIAMDTLADGFRSVTLSLGGTDAYPDAPTITNLTALQAVDPAAPATITWNALPGWSAEPGPGDGLIELEVENAGGWEVVWVEGADLDGGGVSYTIPAGTLWPGRSYQARLHFIRVQDIDTDAYPGSFAAAGFESTTNFTITTTGTPLMPRLTIGPDGPDMRIEASGGEPGRAYVLETSSDLSRWLPQQEIWLADLPYQWTDTDARYLKQRFYRMRDLADGEYAPRHVTIQGTVWTNSLHTTPVAGAIVGTNLDGRTTVTDAAGKFFLETDTPAHFSSTPYTIIITRDGAPRSFGPGVWGDQPREQDFALE